MIRSLVVPVRAMIPVTVRSWISEYSPMPCSVLCAYKRCIGSASSLVKRHKSLGTLLRPASKICSPTLRHTRRAHILARPLITRLSQVAQLRLSPPSESSTHACLRRPLLRQNARIHATWPSESIVSCLFSSTSGSRNVMTSSPVRLHHAYRLLASSRIYL